MNLKTITTILCFLFFLNSHSLFSQIPTAISYVETTDNELVKRARFTPDGSLFISGGIKYEPLEKEDFFLQKYEDGAPIWTYKFGILDTAEQIADMIVAPDGNLVLLVDQRDNFGLSGLNTADFYITKIDSNGDVMWETTVDMGRKDIPQRIVVNAAGEYFVLGLSNSLTGDDFFDDLLWAKLGADGTLISTNFVDLADIDSPGGLDIDVDGNLYFTNQNTLVKMSNTFDVVWEKDISVHYDEALLFDLLVKDDGSVLIAGGGSTSTTTSIDAMLMHFTTDGEFVWQQFYGDEGIEVLEEIIICEVEDKIIGVGYNSPNFLTVIDGFYFLITEMDGTEFSTTTYGGDVDSPSLQYGLTVTNRADGLVVAAGRTTEATGDDLDNDVLLLFSGVIGFSCTDFELTDAPEISYQGQISIFPNPATEEFFVSQEDDFLNSDLQFHLYDILGRKIKEIELKDLTTSISVAELSSGTYFYMVFDKEAMVKNGKLILER